MNKVLFVTSEAHPLIKTGGLADVSGSLPPALRDLGEDVRILLPAYRPVLERIGQVRPVANLTLVGAPESVRLLEGRMPDSGVTVWLVDSPRHFDRDGGPYVGPDGKDWPDNAWRFAVFARAAVDLALDRAGLDWRPDVVHCNDWQSGLVPALLSREPYRPASVFTIHNLAYQGLFPYSTFANLNLPPAFWSPHGMEFHSLFSFIKGGLVYADRITTVSPTYAREIRSRAFGYGLEGLLEYRADRLGGILNGVDYAAWNPTRDPHIPEHYDADSLDRKGASKRAVQERFGLPQDPSVPLVGMVGRIVEQKGLDLLLGAMPALEQRHLQVVLLGTGERGLEEALQSHAGHYPQKVAVYIGYDEAMAHLIEAGADLFLMPSRFEPCGLNQIYSLRYGTVPVVRRTGGLADTVVDADPQALEQGRATGFVFDEATPEALTGAIDRALALYGDGERWRRVLRTGMAQDFGWDKSARQYRELYGLARADRG